MSMMVPGDKPDLGDSRIERTRFFSPAAPQEGTLPSIFSDAMTLLRWTMFAVAGYVLYLALAFSALVLRLIYLSV